MFYVTHSAIFRFQRWVAPSEAQAYVPVRCASIEEARNLADALNGQNLNDYFAVIIRL